MKKHLFLILLMAIFLGLFSFQKLNRPLAPPTYHIHGFRKFIFAHPDSSICSVTMLLHYYSKDVTLAEVKKEAVGLDPDVLRTTLHKFGVESRVYRGTLSQLKKFVATGNPVIVLIRSSNTTWHYCVVYGYDERGVLLGNPSLGNTRYVFNNDFINCWQLSHDIEGKKCDPQADISGFTMIVPGR